MPYKVIISFQDSQNDFYTYKIGDIYPCKGYESSDKRIKELSTSNNKVGEVLIKDMSEPSIIVKRKFPNHIGGSWYELSNGEKVQGKANAQKAEKKLGDN